MWMCSNFQRAVVKTVKGDVVDGNTSYSYVYVNRHDNSKRYYYTENNGTIEPLLGGFNKVTRVNATTLQLTYPDGVIEQFEIIPQCKNIHFLRHKTRTTLMLTQIES